MHVAFFQQFLLSRSYPTGYRTEIISIDIPENLSMCSCPARAEALNDNLTVLILQWCPRCDIQRHRIYNYTVTVINEAGSSISAPVRLSKSFEFKCLLC